MNAHSLLTQALVYLAAGVISVPIAKRLGLGSVLGYLLSGVLIGPYLLNLVGAPGGVQRFAAFGVVILLFLIGLEVRPALLWKMRTTIFGLGAAQMLGAGALVAGASALGRVGFVFIAAAGLGEIFAASALLGVVAVAALMELVGLSPALGAFLAGVVLAESEFRRELETDIEPFRGLLLGLFFITVGAGLDMALVVARPLVLLRLVAGLMALKTLAMYAAGRLFRRAHRTAMTTAVALAQGGEFAFVLLGFVL